MKCSKGFTLIEVIITIVIMAIAAAAFLQFFGKAFTGSAVPAGQVQSQYKLIQQMETITSQYRNQITNNTSFTLTAFKTSFVDGTLYVDSTKTAVIPPLTSSDGVYTTTQPVLRVTLTDGKQTLISIFTQ
jgi:prepilin-type N-terminal cleavage/methylation domain-containing protein